MRPANWFSESGAEEYAISFDSGSRTRVLVIPALFDEANKLRRFTLGVMRCLAAAGVDSVLPDWPGCNESRTSLTPQTLGGWREDARAAADYFAASHVLTIRGGALIDPGILPSLAYAPVTGSSILSAMLRAAAISEREVGREVTRDSLLQQGLRDGLVLAGHPIGAAMLGELGAAQPAPVSRTISQNELGGPALWLRAEPSDDPEQAARLAALMAAFALRELA